MLMQWWKCYINIFDNEKTQYIEATYKADSDTIILVWVKLLNLAAKHNNKGIFTINDKPYTMELFCEMLHKMGKKGQEKVKLAFNVLESLGMIEIKDGIISIKNWNNYQCFEKEEKERTNNAERQQRFREKQKAQKSLVDPEIKKILDQINLKK